MERNLLKAVFRSLFGTDAEMEHPKTKEEVAEKFAEAHEAIDKMHESTAKLKELQPAKTLDEALSQMMGGWHR